MKLKDKIAIVTGASKGIGSGIAKAFGKEGATVIVNYSSGESDANKIVQEIEADGGKAFAFKADMSKSVDIEHMFDKVELEFGKVDILVNNAGKAIFEMIDDLTE